MTDDLLSSFVWFIALFVSCRRCIVYSFFFFQAEDGIRDLVRSRGLGDVYKRQRKKCLQWGQQAQRELVLLLVLELPRGYALVRVLLLSLIHI